MITGNCALLPFQILPSILSRRFVLLGIALLGTAYLCCGAEQQQTISLKHSSAPVATGAGGESSGAIMTPDGRYVLFASTARNLVLTASSTAFEGKAMPLLNVYRHDRMEQRTLLITPSRSGTEFGNGNSVPVALSTNGLLALIESTASNLVPNDTNAASDVFVRDVEHGQTALVSVATNGLPANGASYNAVMTPDGRYVAFASLASNLVPNDTNKVSDIFLRDLQSNVTTLVSTDAPPLFNIYTNLGSDLPRMTPDGSKVAFVFNGRGSSGDTTDVKVRDLSSGVTFWASMDARTLLGLSSSAPITFFALALSDNGESVVFGAGSVTSLATILRHNLDAGTTDLVHNKPLVPNARGDIQVLDVSADGQRVAFLAITNSSDKCVLVWDAGSGGCTLASINLTNGVTTGATFHAPRWDPQGRWVSFVSSAQDLVTNALAGICHLFQRDLITGTTALLDVDGTTGGWPLSSFTVPVLSDDGRFVAFECVRPEVAGNNHSQVFVLDRETGAPELISHHAPELVCATGDNSSFASASGLSANGQLAVFASDAEDLVPNDGNGFRDVFVHDLLACTNRLLSANGDSISGSGPSFDPVTSGNGRFVAFTSAASDFVGNDTNAATDVFLHDLHSNQTAVASIGWNGTAANSNSSALAVSSDARFVLFRSLARNITKATVTGENLFLRDMQQGTNFALTANNSYNAFYLGGTDLTPDGRFAAYSFGGGFNYVSVWDTQVQKAIFSNSIPAVSPQVAITPDGSHIAWISNNSGVCNTILQNVSTAEKFTLADRASRDIPPRFSGDSKWLVFNAQLQSTNQLYLRDVLHGTNVLVSRRFSTDLPAAGDSDSPAISADGRFVAYRSFATNVVPGDTNGSPDIFLFDRTTETTLLVSCQPGASGANGFSGSPCFSADGSTIIFRSWASNLHPLDFNESSDLFAYRISSSGNSFYLQAVMAGGQPALIWPVVPGKTYRVQFKDNLTLSTWQDAPGIVLINGTQGSYTDPIPSVKRFFRVVEQ